MQNLLTDLKVVLAQDERFVVDGKLLKNKIIEAGLQLDPGLIRLLLQNDEIKSHFFQEVEGVLVFDKVKFQQFVSNKEFLPDSYTAFKNKIGLTADGEFLADSKEVVLSWAYKDCLLEGGQDKEDAKRDEVFWNEVLAPGDIDRLLHPKVLTNWKRYTKAGESEVKELSLEDNLILKGNNLLALHSLKRIYASKVKLIYIDPPYNTGGDTFKYNDSFNHSTWLTFMKNRLTAAKDFLSKDGFILVHCDDMELAYLKVLMDEIFGRDNFRNLLLTRRYDKNLNNQFVENGLKSLNVGADYVLIYAKTPAANLFPVYRQASESRASSGYWKGFWNSPDRKTMRYDILGVSVSEGQWKWKEDKAMEAVKNYDEYVSIHSKNMSLEEYWISTGRTKKFIRKNPSGASDGKNKGIEHWIPPSDGILRNSNWTDILTSETLKDFDFKNPKSTTLITELIKLGSDEGDLVMDFFLGSGTTAVAAQRVGRRFIGIEQMDYIESVTIERMKLEMSDGDDGFVYAELKKANQTWIDEVSATRNDEALSDLWGEMQQRAFISYKVEPKAISETAKNFESLEIEDKKRFLVEVLEKNALYVNLSDIENQDFQISEKDKALTKLFYSLK